MPRNGWSPGIVPFGADETAYLVVDSFSNGTVYRETEIGFIAPLVDCSEFLLGFCND